MSSAKSFEELVKKIYRTGCDLASRFGYECLVSLEELLMYLSAPSYEEDVIGLEEIASNRYLCLHEVIEASILKEKGVVIDKDVFSKRNIPLVYKAHLEALKVELKVSAKERNLQWIKRRIKDLLSYLVDPHLPEGFDKEVYRILEFAEELLSQYMKIFLT